MRPSLNLEGHADHEAVDGMDANLLASARNWFEVLPGGAWRQDRLTYEDASTGMPTALPAGVYARSVFPIMAAGTYVVAWDGAATIQVTLLAGGGGSGGGTSEPAAGSTMPEYLAQSVGPLALSGRFEFAHDGNSRQGYVTISSIGTNDPPRNLRITRIEDEADWQGLSVDFRARMARMRPECVRLLDIFGPNTARDSLVTYAQRRPDGWWTQSDVYLDVYTAPSAGWTGTAPALGDAITWSGGSGTWVRTGSPVAGVLGHIKLGSGSPAGSGTITCTRTGATATLTGAMASWQPRVQGPSTKWLRDFAAAMREFGTTTIWITTHFTCDDAYHTALATEIEFDPRLDGLEWVVEFGNESWNSSGSFSVGYNYCNAQGASLGMPGQNPWEKGAQYYAHRQRQIHDLWRAVFVGRESEIPRVFCGQNSAGEYWFRWRTIINPDDDGAFPSWPREVLPIDAWATAAYIGHMDEAPYNTAAWWNNATDAEIVTYLVGDQIPKHITNAPTGSAPYRQGGFRLMSILAEERGCEMWAYEGNFHVYTLEGSSAMTTRVTTWMRTAYCAQAFQALWDAVEAYADRCVCWYNSARTWGSSGWWGLLENPHDGVQNDMRWQVIVTSGSGEIFDATFEEADMYVSARATTWQVVSTGPVVFHASAQTATVSTVGSTSTTEVITPTTLFGKSLPVVVVVAASESKPEIDGTTEGKTEVAVVVFASWETDGAVIPPPGEIDEVSSELAWVVFGAATTTAGRDLWVVSSSPAAAVSAATGTVAEGAPPASGGRIGLRWALMNIANAPKPIGIELRRGAILGWENSGPILAVAPLRAGRPFAGVAVAHAEPTEGVASISRDGLFDVELEDVPADREVDVVAIDDQRIYSATGAQVAGLAYTPIGRGIYRGDGVCSVAYHAEAFR